METPWLPVAITMLITLTATLMLIGMVIGGRALIRKVRNGEIQLTHVVVICCGMGWMPFPIYPVSTDTHLPENHDGFPRDI